MYYIYSRHIDSGEEDCVGYYNSMKEAASVIGLCYVLDAIHDAKGENYYFVKKQWE